MTQRGATWTVRGVVSPLMTSGGCCSLCGAYCCSTEAVTGPRHRMRQISYCWVGGIGSPSTERVPSSSSGSKLKTVSGSLGLNAPYDLGPSVLRELYITPP